MNLQTFDVDFAGQHGLEPAILFQAIGYWCHHNKSKPDRRRDGKAWMYMSRREWLEEFQFIGEGTLRSSLQKLVDAGLIETGQYSEGMYARKTLYCLTDKGWDLWLKQPTGSAESAKGFGQNSQTITATHSTTTISQAEPPSPAKPTKASSRGDPRIRLSQFIENAGTPDDWFNWARSKFGWDAGRCAFEWDDFYDYWTSGDAAGGGLKSDWPATWRSHCRRVSGIKGRGPRPAGNGAGQGGGARRDIMAAATDTVLSDLFGVQRKGRGGAPAPADTGPDPFGDGGETVEAVFVDAGPGDEARQLTAGGAGGGGEDSHARIAVPEPVE